MKSLLLVSVMMAAQVAFAQLGSNTNELHRRIQDVNALTQARFDFIQAQLEEVAVLVASEVTGSQSVSVESTDATEISRAAGFDYYAQATASQSFYIKMLNGDMCLIKLENRAGLIFFNRKVNILGFVEVKYLQCVNLLGVPFTGVYSFTDKSRGIHNDNRFSVATDERSWEAFSAIVGTYDKNTYSFKIKKAAQ